MGLYSGYSLTIAGSQPRLQKRSLNMVDLQHNSYNFKTNQPIWSFSDIRSLDFPIFSDNQPDHHAIPTITAEKKPGSEVLDSWVKMWHVNGLDLRIPVDLGVSYFQPKLYCTFATSLFQYHPYKNHGHGPYLNGSQFLKGLDNGPWSFWRNPSRMTFLEVFPCPICIANSRKCVAIRREDSEMSSCGGFIVCFLLPLFSFVKFWLLGYN